MLRLVEILVPFIAVLIGSVVSCRDSSPDAPSKQYDPKATAEAKAVLSSVNDFLYGSDAFVRLRYAL